MNHTETHNGSPLKLVMPPEPGDYEIRYVQRQGHKVLARQPITVTQVGATLGTPEQAAAGETIPVTWKGPDYPHDYIAVAKPDQKDRDLVNHTETHNGSPLKLVMPPEPGNYEIRYVQRQGHKVLARQPITVTQVGATLDTPEQAAAGETIAVTWTGPDYPHDYIAVAKPEQKDRDSVNHTETHNGSPLKLVMPPEPGNYEIRYVQRQGHKVLARQPITVTP